MPDLESGGFEGAERPVRKRNDLRESRFLAFGSVNGVLFPPAQKRWPAALYCPIHTSVEASARRLNSSPFHAPRSYGTGATGH